MITLSNKYLSRSTNSVTFSSGTDVKAVFSIGSGFVMSLTGTKNYLFFYFNIIRSIKVNNVIQHNYHCITKSM